MGRYTRRTRSQAAPAEKRRGEQTSLSGSGTCSDRCAGVTVKHVQEMAGHLKQEAHELVL